MLPALIFWFYKKYFYKISGKADQTIQKKNSGKNSFTMLFVFITINLHSQEQTRQYKVLYKGNIVGSVQFYQKQTGNDIFLKMTLNVSMSFIINVRVNTEEESKYSDGKLVYSSLYRNVNGKQKANKKTIASGDIYETTSEGKKGSLNYTTIDYNFLLLYCHEPVNLSKVYSDNFQQFLSIKKEAEHRYKIVLPDGNYNYYTYKNGICESVEVHHSLYTIQLKLQ